MYVLKLFIDLSEYVSYEQACKYVFINYIECNKKKIDSYGFNFNTINTLFVYNL